MRKSKKTSRTKESPKPRLRSLKRTLLIPAVVVAALYGAFTGLEIHFRNLLHQHPAFSGTRRDQYPDVHFRYADPSDENLMILRRRYSLDSVAGAGSDAERVMRLMKWVHRLSRHAVNPEYPRELNALSLIPLCLEENQRLNCVMYSIVLNEVYLSLGYASRIIHLKPRSGEHRESHWVTAVYLPEAGKWVMMDSDMCGYLRDEQGILLGLSEIRRRLIAREPLIVNEDIGGFSRWLGKWSYTWYLRKNIFRYNCDTCSEFGQLNHENRKIVELLPDGFREDLLATSEITPRGRTVVYINDESLFWQSPRRGRKDMERNPTASNFENRENTNPPENRT